jgi:hypothetical protein
MARASAADTRFLEQKNGKWRVTVAVPRDLRSVLGTRLKRSLHTDSLAVANRLKWQAVSELRANIESARKKSGGGRDPIRREAVEVAAYLARAQTAEEREDLQAGIIIRAEQIAGRPIGSQEDPITGDAIPVYDAERERRAGEYVALARGEATPIELHHELFIGQSNTKSRTRADDRRALGFLRRGSLARMSTAYSAAACRSRAQCGRQPGSREGCGPDVASFRSRTVWRSRAVTPAHSSSISRPMTRSTSPELLG